MMRKFVSSLLDLPIRWADESVPAGEILHGLQSGYERLLQQFTANPGEFHGQTAKDLRETAKCLVEIGLIQSTPAELQATDEGDHAEAIAKARAWRDALPDGKILSKEGFACGCGEMLDVLDKSGSEKDRIFVSDSLEKLLRNVEVKRKVSLHQTNPPLGEKETALERDRVIILFCRVARRHKDVRLLNAALKLNDWAFKKAGRSNTFPIELQCSRMLCMAEQEAAAKELLQ